MAHGRLAARGGPASVMRDDTIARVFSVNRPVGGVQDGGRPFIVPRRAVPYRPS